MEAERSRGARAEGTQPQLDGRQKVYPRGQTSQSQAEEGACREEWAPQGSQRGSGTQSPPTHAGPAEEVLLKADFTVTAVGTREVVAHLAVPALVHACLTLVHICQGKAHRVP